jgi:MoaA/NifB/PqqE/SkfB family radical SAM enzyme
MLGKLAFRLEDRNFLTLLKLAEVRLLGQYASTYCYNHPSHVYLELTARCNLKCSWCAQVHDEFRQGYVEDMPFEMFRDIVPKLKGTKVLYLCSNGEPLLYDRLFDAIEVARRYIPSVRFVTNGVLLSRDVGKELKKAGLSQLGVSIDSPDRALMLKIRGVSIETITNNVKEFCMGTGIPVEVRSTICAENVDSLKHLPVFAGNFSTCRLLYFTLAEGMSEVDSSPMTMLRNRKEFLGLKQAVVRQCRELSLFGRHLAINCKGYIMPCCRYWGHHLDNIGELSFAEAWNGRLTRSWRRQMLNRKYTDDCSNFCGYPGFPGE